MCYIEIAIDLLP